VIAVPPDVVCRHIGIPAGTIVRTSRPTRDQDGPFVHVVYALDGTVVARKVWWGRGWRLARVVPS